MKKEVFKVLVLFAVISMATACGPSISKLIKKGTHQEIYDKALELYKARKYQKTLTLLEEITPHYGGTSREDTIIFLTGASFFKTGDFETSGMVFNDFRRIWGRSAFIEDAEEMLAMGYYYSSPASERDQTATKQAIVAINEFLSRYPNTAKKEVMEGYIAELTQKLHDKAFINAKTYYTIGRYKSAVVALKNALNQYPESNRKEELLYLIVKSDYLLAKHSLEDLQRDRYLTMLDDYYVFVGEFPESKYRKEMDKAQEEAKAFLAKFKGEGDIIVPAN